MDKLDLVLELIKKIEEQNKEEHKKINEELKKLDKTVKNRKFSLTPAQTTGITTIVVALLECIKFFF